MTRIRSIVLRMAMALVGVGVIGGLVWWNARVAPTPEAFVDAAHTLSDAEAEAKADGRVVVAIVTADWCGACQQYKRGALASPKVAAWIREFGVPAVIDVTVPGNSDAERLRVNAIPVTAVMRNGEVVAARVGALSEDEVMAMLKGAEGAGGG